MIRPWFDSMFLNFNSVEHFKAKLKKYIQNLHRTSARFCTQVGVRFWQTKQGILGETMPLIRDLLNLGEMTAIHLGISEQSRRGGGGDTLPKHD